MRCALPSLLTHDPPSSSMSLTSLPDHGVAFRPSTSLARVQSFALAMGLKYRYIGQPRRLFVIEAGARKFGCVPYKSSEEFWNEWRARATRTLRNQAWATELVDCLPERSAPERAMFLRWWRGADQPYGGFMREVQRGVSAGFRLPRTWRAEYLKVAPSLEYLDSMTERFVLIDLEMARRGHADYHHDISEVDVDWSAWRKVKTRSRARRR